MSVRCKVMLTVNLPIEAINPTKIIGKEIEVWSLMECQRLLVEEVEYDVEYPEMVSLSCSNAGKGDGPLKSLVKGRR